MTVFISSPAKPSQRIKQLVVRPALHNVQEKEAGLLKTLPESHYYLLLSPAVSTEGYYSCETALSKEKDQYQRNT